MRQCLGCKGLVPASSSVCPNCALRKLVLATGTLALLSTGVACTPAYGVPCTKLSDGGNSCFDECTVVQPDGGLPRDNPANTGCFVDGGTP